jgi:histone H3/H4
MAMQRAAAAQLGKASPQAPPTPQDVARFQQRILNMLRAVVRGVYELHKTGLTRTIKETDVRQALGQQHGSAVPEPLLLPTKHCTRKQSDAGDVNCCFFPKASLRELVKSQEPPTHRLRWTKNAMTVLQRHVEDHMLISLGGRR